MPDLKERLVRRIRASGPLTFAQYMEAALYDPEAGYYTTRARIGFDGGDYFTSADLGPMFGRTLARAAAELHLVLGRPAPWDLVEAGAGRGTVMRDLLAALERERPGAAQSVRPAIVEVSPHLRREQARALDGRELRWAASPGGLAPIHGVVFANEVLDAFPVHVLERAADGVKEVWIDERGGELVELLRAPATQDLRWRMPEALPVGGRWEVSPDAEGWVAALAAAMSAGYAVFIDYGGDETDLIARQGAGTVRGFRAHRLVSDPLAEPGAHDLTATVNFSAIGRAAEGAGLRLVASSTQRDMLIALGVREETGRPASPLDQLRAASRRSAIDVLTDPRGLGGFRVVCYAKDAPRDVGHVFGAP